MYPRMALNSTVQLRMSLNFFVILLPPMYHYAQFMKPGVLGVLAFYQLSYSPSPDLFPNLATSPDSSNSTDMRCAHACARPGLPVQEVQFVHGCQPCSNLACHPLQQHGL